MPIKDSSGDVIGVAQVINKLNCERFTENDEKVKIDKAIFRSDDEKPIVKCHSNSIRYSHHIYNSVALDYEMRNFTKNLN